MKKYLYKEGIVFIYYLVLRVALYSRIDLPFINIGLIYDLFLIMFVLLVLNRFIKKNKTRSIVYILLMVFMFVLTVGNILFASIFDVLLSVTNANAIKWWLPEYSSDYDLSIPTIYFPLIISLVTFSVLTFYTKNTITVTNRRLMISSLVLIVNLITGLVFFITPEEATIEYYQSDDYLYQSDYNKQLFTTKWGFFNYYLIDLVRVNIDDIDNDKEVVDDYFDNLPPHQDNSYSNMYEGYNVITILSETLDTRFISEDLTPNLYMMRETGTSFSNFYTTVYQNGATCNSEYMSLTGLNAVNTDQLSINACDAYNENLYPYTLPTQLEAAGYNSYYFHGEYPELYDRFQTIPNYGFEEVYFQKDLYDSYPEYDGHLDTHLTYFMDEYINYDQLFYANILTYSMHGAYTSDRYEMHQDQVMSAHSEETNSEIINYMEKLVEFDNMLGEILVRLENEGVLDNTLIAIFPDHYPYMMDHEFYMDYWDVDKYELKRQDLILYTTSMEPSVITMTGSTEDIAPTILNLINKDAIFDYFTGSDLLSNKSNYVLFNDMTLTDGENYLKLNGEYTGNPTVQAILERQLPYEMNQYEVSRKINHIDYFRIK